MAKQHTERTEHWDEVYAAKRNDDLSWFQDDPEVSLELMELAGLNEASSVIDVGAGSSRIAACLIARGLQDVTALDLSSAALASAQRAMGETAEVVNWLVADVTAWSPQRQYDLWHDRAVFHFLVAEGDRRAYRKRLAHALGSGAHAVIATFALDGPEKCSGLPVRRYSPESLSEELGESFQLLARRSHEHRTPWGAVQRFQFSLFRKL